MKERISSLQLGAITWNLVLSSYIGIIPYILFYTVKQDSWMSVLLSALIGIFIIGIYLYIWGKLPDKNIFQKVDFVFGKTIGSIINLAITFVNIFMTATYFYSMIHFISSQYLFKTPDLFIIIIFVIPVVYLITQKLEVIGRTLFVFWIIGCSLFLVTIFGLVFQIDFSNLFPILENGVLPVFKGALLSLPYTHFILFLFMCIPKDSVIDKDKANKRILVFYVISILSIFTGILLITSSLGSSLASIYQFVEFQVLKRVSLISFIERIESTLSTRWILYMFATAIMGLYFSKKYLIHTFNIKKHEKLIIGILAIITLLACRLIYPNNTIFNELTLNILPYILYIIYLIIPIAVAIGLKFKK